MERRVAPLKRIEGMVDRQFQKYRGMMSEIEPFSDDALAELADALFQRLDDDETRHCLEHGSDELAT